MTAPRIEFRESEDELEMQLFVDDRLAGRIEAWKFQDKDEAHWFPAWRIDPGGAEHHVICMAHGLFKTVEQAQHGLLVALGLQDSHAALATASADAADTAAPAHAHLALYPNAIAAAQCATEAASELLRCAREEDAIDIDETLLKLLDAARLVAEIESREENSQILGAFRKWLDEHT